MQTSHQSRFMIPFTRMYNHCLACDVAFHAPPENLMVRPWPAEGEMAGAHSWQFFNSDYGEVPIYFSPQKSTLPWTHLTPFLWNVFDTLGGCPDDACDIVQL